MSTERTAIITPIRVNGKPIAIGDTQRMLIFKSEPAHDDCVSFSINDGDVFRVSVADIIEAVKATSRGY